MCVMYQSIPNCAWKVTMKDTQLIDYLQKTNLRNLWHTLVTNPEFGTNLNPEFVEKVCKSETF